MPTQYLGDFSHQCPVGMGVSRGFLIMPFDPQLEDVRRAVVAAGLDEGVRVERSDDISRPGVVLDQIFEAIDKSDVVVAVCTGKNPNVFFELGYAWRRRDAILVAETTNDLPFDVQHFRTEIYGGLNAAQNSRTLRSRLGRAFKAVLAESLAATTAYSRGEAVDRT